MGHNYLGDNDYMYPVIAEMGHNFLGDNNYMYPVIAEIGHNYIGHNGINMGYTTDQAPFQLCYAVLVTAQQSWP